MCCVPPFLLLQVMQRYMNIHAVAVQGTFEEIAAYAARVAKGYRPPISPKLPSIIVGLIEVGVLCVGVRVCVCVGGAGAGGRGRGAARVLAWGRCEACVG